MILGEDSSAAPKEKKEKKVKDSVVCISFFAT
jgi:hypothetical protein